MLNVKSTNGANNNGAQPISVDGSCCDKIHEELLCQWCCVVGFDGSEYQVARGTPVLNV